MSIFEDTNPRELKELLTQIHGRESALPDFQRDFVWDPNATQHLIVSIANNYPAGSLLRIRNTHNLFASREFQGAPSLENHQPTYLVLDGQQRLTSLYQAFFGVGDHRYFLDLKLLLDGAEFEECIFHARARTKRAKRLEDEDVQATELVLPLSVLKDGSGGYTRWIRRVARRHQDDGRDIDKLEDDLYAIAERWIEPIDGYRFPVVTLSDQTSAEAVCTIFETLNRTGVKLSVFELLTARFWPKNVNLRHLWEKTRIDYPIIADFNIDPYYILQLIALVALDTPNAQQRAVLNLEATSIEEWWDRVTFGLATALRMLQEDCGVITPQWLPYNIIPLPIAATLAKLSLKGSPEVGANRQKLVRWYWCSVFGQTYERATNSQATKDTVELVRWLTGGEAPESVSAFQFDPRILQDATSRQRALYRGAMGVVLRHRPRDFHSGEQITGERIVENHIDDHHIFPNSFLAKQSIPTRLRDCVLNRTLIDRQTNKRIRDRPPSEYMRDIQEALGFEAFDRLLESHRIPSGLSSPIWRNDFAAFIDLRQKAIWKEIQQVTGVTEAADLLEEEASA